LAMRRFSFPSRVTLTIIHAIVVTSFIAMSD
jgi:hypothetical protein